MVGVPLGNSHAAGGVWGDTHPGVAAEGLKPLTQLGRERARLSCPDGAAIDTYHRDNFCPCPGHKAFIGGIQVVAREEPFRSRQPKSLGYFQDTVACHTLEGSSRG